MKIENPYASMEKDQLISMIHFLDKREDERAQENPELRDMVKELRDTHKQDVKTQSYLMKYFDSVLIIIKAFMQGKTDNENMLPMTIGII